MRPGRLHSVYLENSSLSHFFTFVFFSVFVTHAPFFYFMPSQSRTGQGSIALRSPPPTFHDSRIDVTWVSWQDSVGALIKVADRLLAISFVYLAEQASAEIESRKASEDQCQIQSKAFYHSASITGVCRWVILHTYLIESQFNHLLQGYYNTSSKAKGCVNLYSKSKTASNCRWWHLLCARAVY